MIHETAIVDPAAEIGTDVTIGPYSVVGPEVRLGDDTQVGSFCSLGVDGPGGALSVGKRSLIRSHSVLYGDSTFGPELETGHHVNLREGLRVGRNLRVGTGSDLQGQMKIGNYCRLHSHVLFAQGSVIGDFVWIFPFVVFTQDPHPPSDRLTQAPTIEDKAVIATMSVIFPGITIGSGSLVGAASVVTRDVLPGRMVFGSPARDVCAATEVPWGDGAPGSPYPWWHHFQRGYPAEVAFNEEGPTYAG